MPLTRLQRLARPLLSLHRSPLRPWTCLRPGVQFSTAPLPPPSGSPLAVDDADVSDDDDLSPDVETPQSSSQSYLLHSLANKSDEEVVELVLAGKLSQYKLEREMLKAIGKGLDPDCARAVRIRRLWLSTKLKENTNTSVGLLSCESNGLPSHKFDYETFYKQVLGTNCENVIGYVPIPVGFVGPLLLNGKQRFVPMATTEGALVASTNRGCRAITESGGATASIFADGMTRAPLLIMPTARQAAEMKLWLEDDSGEALKDLRTAFASTTRFGKLLSIKAMVAGRKLFLRFKCFTGDAMGMNMISKGVLEALKVVEKKFPAMEVLSLSGNLCTDKKPSAINWMEGRGKSVVVETVLSGHVIVDVLKCNVESMVQVNVSKNLVGSALAGSIGGNNAHASNVVTACFLATGQDPAQNVESSNCMTLMSAENGGQDLRVSVTMPSLEVGTVGGGTTLAAQRACLDMLGVGGPSQADAGTNSRELAQIIAGTVLAGEISLMAALASNHLVSAHMKLNR